jgi:hypothetical protein
MDTKMKNWQRLLIVCGVLAVAGAAGMTGGHYLTLIFAWFTYNFYKNFSRATDAKEKSKQKKLLILFSVITLFFCYQTFSSNSSSLNVASNTTKQSQGKKIEQDRFSKNISDVTGLPVEAANSLEKILITDMRFSDNFKIQHDKMLDGYKDNQKTKGYRCADDGIVNVIIYLTDNKITAIRHDNYDMFVDGKAVLGKYDFVIEHESDLLTFAREDVKRFLKYPDSAEFGWYSDWKAAKNPKEIIVQSWVESKNGFGNTVRQSFQLKYTPDGKQLTSVIIGNQRCL